MRLILIMILVVLTGCVSTEVHQRQLSLSNRNCKIKIDDLQNKHSFAIRASERSEREANRRARDLSKTINELRGKLNSLQEANTKLQVTASRLVKDSDGDGLTDQRDQCVNEPETWNGIDDHDGCPDREPTVQVSSSQSLENNEELCTGLGCYIHAILGKNHFLEQMRDLFQAKRGFMTEREIEKIRLKALKMKSRFDSFEVCGLKLETSKGLDSFKIAGSLYGNGVHIDDYKNNSYINIDQSRASYGDDAYESKGIVFIDTKVIKIKQKKIYNAIQATEDVCAEVSIKRVKFFHRLFGKVTSRHAVIGHIRKISLKTKDRSVLYQFNQAEMKKLYKKCDLSRSIFHECNMLLQSDKQM